MRKHECPTTVRGLAEQIQLVIRRVVVDRALRLPMYLNYNRFLEIDPFQIREKCVEERLGNHRFYLLEFPNKGVRVQVGDKQKSRKIALFQ